MPKHRLEAFSDGVFAIVITLLVLDLRPEHAELGARAMIAGALPNMATFGFSFAVIGTYWVAHHRMLHFVQSVDRGTLWWNLALLMAVAFVPYPTSLVAATHFAVDAVRLYGITLIAANLLGTALWLHGTAPSRRADRLGPGRRARVASVHLAPVPVYAIGIALAPWSMSAALCCFAAVPAAFVLGGQWIERIAVDAAA